MTTLCSFVVYSGFVETRFCITVKVMATLPKESKTTDWNQIRQRQNAKYGHWLNDLGQWAQREKGPRDRDFQILQRMLIDGEPVDTVGGYKETALLRGMGHGIWVPLLLLRYGADPNFRCYLWDSMYGGTILHMAAEQGNLPLIKALLSVGADTTLRDKSGKTAQEICKDEKCANFIQQFVKDGTGKVDIKSGTLQMAYDRVTNDK